MLKKYTVNNIEMQTPNHIQINNEQTIPQGRIMEMPTILNRRRPVLSVNAKKILAEALLIAEAENTRITNDTINRHCSSENILTKSVMDAQRRNFDELVLENEMLRKSVEKYRALYYGLYEKLNVITSDHEEFISD